MAPVNPPSYQQAGSYSARLDRLALAGLLTPHAPTSALAARSGVKPSPSNAGLAVVQRSTPDRWVTINAGTCYIPATSSIGGTYECHNDAAYDVQTAAAHATLARKDLICARVYDAIDDVGVLNELKIEVVTGTPAGSPSRPATPNQAIALAEVNVAAASTTVVTANITDLRQRVVALGGTLPCRNSSEVPASPHGGMRIWREDLKQELLWDGTAWRAGFDEQYNFGFGTLGWAESGITLDYNITTTTEGAAGSAVPEMTFNFTMPSGVPTTRRLYAIAIFNYLAATGDNFGSFWIDGAAWSGARRIANTGAAETVFDLYLAIRPPLTAGAHSIQFRMWNDSASETTTFLSGELALILL